MVEIWWYREDGFFQVFENVFWDEDDDEPDTFYHGLTLTPPVLQCR